jgi:hypothetical protein
MREGVVVGVTHIIKSVCNQDNEGILEILLSQVI